MADNGSKSGQQKRALDKTLLNPHDGLDKTMLDKTLLEPKHRGEQISFDPNKTSLDQSSTEIDYERNVTEFSPDKFIGSVIAERFELLSLAGRGGMSAVYKARHIFTHKIVALKLMLPHLLTDENAVRRFQQEARAASRLNHPNAISVQDMGVNADGQPFLTMDFLDGRSLADEIRFNKKLKPKRCLHIFTQVCAALAHAHEQQIIHRDLKPSNVMLINQDDDPDFVIVVDFGIAKIISDGGVDSLKLTTTGDVFGSPLYMSPEQCLGNKLDIRSDVYSMGCLMFESLTGGVPHEGKNVLETMFKHTNLAAPTLSSIDADPRTIYALDQILQKCLAKLPEQRYQTMTALRKDLENVAQADKKGLKIAAQIGMGAADKGRQFDNRLASYSPRKLFWISVPLLVMLAVVVLGFGYYWISTSGDPGPSDRTLTLNRDIFHNENMDRLASTIEQQSSNPSSVMKQSFDQLGLENDNHQFYSELFSQLLRSKHSDDPQSFYYKMMRFGFFFTKNMDYEKAIKAFNCAIETAARNGFTNSIDDAKMQAAMANCMLSMGSVEKKDDLANDSAQVDAFQHARLAYKEFAEGNSTTDPSITSLLGTLLELCSAQPDKFEEGYRYLNNLIENHQMSPAIEGIAYAQAAQFAHAVAANGGANATIPIIRLDARTQRKQQKQVLATEVEQEFLQKSADSWEELRKKHPRVSNFNQGVIYNRMGLLAEQQKDLAKAEEYFLLSIDHLAAANNAKDESAAKVLFNLSDVQLAQHRFIDYYNTHTDAKRVWEGTFHLGKRTSPGV